MFNSSNNSLFEQTPFSLIYECISFVCNNVIEFINFILNNQYFSIFFYTFSAMTCIEILLFAFLNYFDFYGYKLKTSTKMMNNEIKREKRNLERKQENEQRYQQRKEQNRREREAKFHDNFLEGQEVSQGFFKTHKNAYVFHYNGHTYYNEPLMSSWLEQNSHSSTSNKNYKSNKPVKNKAPTVKHHTNIDVEYDDD